MDGVPIYGIDIALVEGQLSACMFRSVDSISYLLMIVEYAEAREWPCAHHMPVGENIALLSIHDKASCFARSRGISVKGAGLAKVDGHDIPHDPLNGRLPLCSISGS